MKKLLLCCLFLALPLLAGEGPLTFAPAIADAPNGVYVIAGGASYTTTVGVRPFAGTSTSFVHSDCNVGGPGSTAIPVAGTQVFDHVEDGQCRSGISLAAAPASAWVTNTFFFNDGATRKAFILEPPTYLDGCTAGVRFGPVTRTSTRSAWLLIFNGTDDVASVSIEVASTAGGTLSSRVLPVGAHSYRQEAVFSADGTGTASVITLGRACAPLWVVATQDLDDRVTAGVAGESYRRSAVP